jgi:rubrerythrin
MSEMTDIRNRKIFLEICMGIEEICAGLYHFYSDIYKDIPEASGLWKKTALEEEYHRKQFELALRQLYEVELEVSEDSLKQAYSIQYKLLILMNHIRSNKPELLTAISMAVEMEEELADLHENTAIIFKDESMQNLFTFLGDTDREHAAALQRLRTLLHLPHCEI